MGNNSTIIAFISTSTSPPTAMGTSRPNDQADRNDVHLTSLLDQQEPRQPHFDPRETNVVEYYMLPLIFLMGTFCNIMTFCVMRRKKMRHQSTYFYMAVLALTDEMVLIFGCLNFWIYLNYLTNLTLLWNISCKLVCLLFYATLHFSVWMVVIMTIERFIAVALPLQAMHLCTVKRAMMATFLLAAVILAINSHFLFTHMLKAGANDTMNSTMSCMPTGPMTEEFMNKIWPWIDASIYSFVPLFLLIFFNILIIWSLVRASRNINKLTNRIPKSNGNNNGNSTYHHHHHRHAQYNHYQFSNNSTQNGYGGSQNQQPQVSSTNRRLTIMLLVVSTTFLITSTPIVTLQTVELVGGLTPSSTLSIIKGVFLSLQYLNHSINFFLYAVTGKTFRREFLAMFRPILAVKKNATAASGAKLATTGATTTSSAAIAKKGAYVYKPVRQIREIPII